MTEIPTIDATRLLSVQLLPDGRTLRLRLEDREGHLMTLNLPAAWLDTLVHALPWPPQDEAVHKLASWNMDRSGAGQDLLLTLRTPEGQASTFAVKSWQIEAMATIATYGRDGAASRDALH